MIAVLFCIALEDDGATPVLRPALVVRQWSETCLNLQVFLDGSNDDHHGALPCQLERNDHVVWCTSVAKGDGVGQWREIAAPETEHKPRKRGGGDA